MSGWLEKAIKKYISFRDWYVDILFRSEFLEPFWGEKPLNVGEMEMLKKLKANQGTPIKEAPIVKVKKPEIIPKYDRPSISKRDTPIYNYNYETNITYELELSPQIQNIPNIPPRRLPKEASGQTAYDTPNGKPIAIKEALVERKFGSLIHRPLNQKKQKFVLVKFDAVQEEFLKKNQEGMQKLIAWMTAQLIGKYSIVDIQGQESKQKEDDDDDNLIVDFWEAIVNVSKGIIDTVGNLFGGDDENGEKSITFWNASALVSAQSLRGFQGEINFIYGLETLHLLAREYSLTRLNAYQDITGLIPINYEVEEFDPKIEETYQESKNPFINTSTSLLPKVYDILGGSMWDSEIFQKGEVSVEGWLRAAGLIQFKEGKENNKVAIANLPDLVRHFLASLYFRSGFHRFPAEVPQWLLDIEDKEGKDKDKKENAYISDNLHFQEWTVRQLDALFGQFPIKIKYRDAQDKEQELILENIAETLAELTGLGLNIANDSDTSVAIGMKNLVETTKAANIALAASDYAKANAEYLGYRSKEYTREVPLTFTPKAESMKEILKESKQKVVGFRFDDKEDLQEQINKLLLVSQMVKAALFMPWKPGQKITGDWIKDQNEKIKTQGDEDWKALLRRLNNPEGIYKVEGNPTPKIDEFKKNPEE
jgi:hypothetical protein